VLDRSAHWSDPAGQTAPTLASSIQSKDTPLK
jgi:hypothetical protein